MKRDSESEAVDERVEEILRGFPEIEGAAIPLLQKVQAELGYLSPDVIRAAAWALGLSESELYGVATFYAEFRLAKPGRHQIKVCMGTSCYLRGGRELLDHVSRLLKLRPGRTREDGEFSLDAVACLGCCSKSPVMSVDGVIHGGLTSSQADDILSCLES
jgi:NADH-quinone oxidoreductase subunit E